MTALKHTQEAKFRTRTLYYQARLENHAIPYRASRDTDLQMVDGPSRAMKGAHAATVHLLRLSHPAKEQRLSSKKKCEHLENVGRVVKDGRQILTKKARKHDSKLASTQTTRSKKV